MRTFGLPILLLVVMSVCFALHEHGRHRPREIPPPELRAMMAAQIAGGREHYLAEHEARRALAIADAILAQMDTGEAPAQ